MGDKTNLFLVFVVVSVITMCLLAVVGVLFDTCDDNCLMEKMTAAYHDCVMQGISDEVCATMASQAYAKSSSPVVIPMNSYGGQ